MVAYIPIIKKEIMMKFHHLWSVYVLRIVEMNFGTKTLTSSNGMQTYGRR